VPEYAALRQLYVALNSSMTWMRSCRAIWKRLLAWIGADCLQRRGPPPVKGPQGDAIDRTIAFWKFRNIPYRTLRDGEVLVVDGRVTEVVT